MRGMNARHALLAVHPVHAAQRMNMRNIKHPKHWVHALLPMLAGQSPHGMNALNAWLTMTSMLPVPPMHARNARHPGRCSQSLLAGAKKVRCMAPATARPSEAPAGRKRFLSSRTFLLKLAPWMHSEQNGYVGRLVSRRRPLLPLCREAELIGAEPIASCFFVCREYSRHTKSPGLRSRPGRFHS